ncbi:MAG: Ig-like domain-containing protein [Patescibacteria group bacterium]|nr:Ig-like domain-containing protein [Patescibacteria group bacterium]
MKRLTTSLVFLVIFTFVHFSCANGGDAKGGGGNGGGDNGSGNAPFAMITSPTDGATVHSGAINVTAIGNDSEGGGEIVQLTILVDNNVLCGNNTENVTCAWYPLPGSYELKAVATNDKGVAGTSGIVHVTVLAGPILSITIVSPTDGATGEALYSTFIVMAVTSDGDAITEVTVYDGGTVIGTVSTAPFTFAWRNVWAGSYALKAEVTDAKGHTAMSAVTHVTVLNPPNNTVVWCYANPPANSYGQAASIDPDTEDDSQWRSYSDVEMVANCATINTDGRIPYVWLDGTVGKVVTPSQPNQWFGSLRPPSSITVNGAAQVVLPYFTESYVGSGYFTCLTADCGLHTGYGQVLLRVFSDADKDGVQNTSDNCQLFTNTNQVDSNSDGIGDACAGLDDDNDGFMNVWDDYPNDPTRN